MAKKKIPQKVIKTVESYINKLQKKCLNLREVYLFGSYAKGTYHKWSDIDVCVVSDDIPDGMEGIIYMNQMAPTLIEAHGFTKKEFANKYSTLIHEIKQYGIKMYSSETEQNSTKAA